MLSDQPREPIPVAALGETPSNWLAIHEQLHSFEHHWGFLTDPEAKDAFVKATALFLGGICSEAIHQQLALAKAQALVRKGFIDYQAERNNVCQAVTSAHTFEHGDQTVN